MINFIQPGDNISVPAPAPIASSEFVKIGSLTGVATGNADTGEMVTLVRKGVFTFPKAPADVPAVGDPIFWTGSEMSTDEAGGVNPLVGTCVEAAAGDSPVVKVLLDGVIRE